MKASNAMLDMLNAYNAGVPFNTWMGVQVTSATNRRVELCVPWRPEFSGAPGMTHGGVLGSLVDTAGFLVLLAAHGTVGPTVDMRTDFHRSTANGTLYACGQLVRAGATISTVEVTICDSENRLAASGRCVYLTQSRKHSDPVAVESWLPRVGRAGP